MPINHVIIDSSPLIVLFKSSQYELLPQLFTEIIVPSGVFEEVVLVKNVDAASRELSNMPWIQRVETTSISPEIAAWDLGKGESQVLSLASEMEDVTAIVDDQAARRCGKTLGIATIGTGGLLVLAKRRGLIDSVNPRIQSLRDSGLWLSDTVVNFLKKQAGE